MPSSRGRSPESPGISGSIPDRISRNYPNFTDAIRVFADYVLVQPVEVARVSIHGAVESAGVSVATANRFARAIGFKGYAEFRAELISGFSSAFAPVEKLRNEISRQSTSAEIITASINQDVANLESTLKDLRPEACDRAVEMILNANRIYVVGIDNSSHLAGVLASGLGRYRDNVRSLSSADGAIGASRQLFRYGADDLVITIAFPRYFRDSVALSRFVRDRGVPLIAITDGPKSPIASLTDTVLYARAERQLASTSNTSVLALLEGLIGAVAHRSPDPVEVEQQFANFALPWFEQDYKSGRKRPNAFPSGRHVLPVQTVKKKTK